MNILFERCAGLDVHKQLVVACIIRTPPAGPPQLETRSFGTMTTDILGLSDWLAEHEVTHSAMESTGVYWKPLFNLLEGTFTVWIFNAQHVKNVPGRKTDVKDAHWLAMQMHCGPAV